MTILKLPLFELNDKAEGKGAAADARPMALWLGCVGSAEPCRGGAVFELLCAGAAFFVGPEAGAKAAKASAAACGCATTGTSAPLARKAGARLRAGKRRGLPFLWNRLRGRPGLLFGGAAFFALLCAFSQCFWTVEVTGCRTIPETGAARGACGIRRGARCAESGVFPRTPCRRP